MTGFGERIQHLLEESGFTQREFASMIGVSEATLSRSLSNEREPKMEIIANIATALNTTTDYLLRGVVDENSFEETYRLVARGTASMSDEERMQIMKVLLNNGK